MKKLYIILFITVLVCSLSAQTSEKKAKEILKKVTAKTKSYKTIEVNFTYKMKNEKANIDESKKGEILIKGEKYHLEIAGQIVINNGQTVWTIIKDAEEVQINTIEVDNESLSPNKLLTSYYEKYKSKLIKETKENGKTVQIIDCVPLKGKSYFKVRLTIDKFKAQIVSFAIYDKNGSIFTYQIDTFKPNVNIPESKFTFNKSKYRDYDIIDMR